MEFINIVHVIYPEDVHVVEDVVLGWAHDALVNAAVDAHVQEHGVIEDTPEGERIYQMLVIANPRPTDLETAKEILSDLGSHTFAAVLRCGAFVNRMQDVPAMRALARACFPKEQHETRGAAEAQMRSITRRGLEKNPAIHVYKCPHCKTWHVGHGRIA
jgi:hypothetical protein